MTAELAGLRQAILQALVEAARNGAHLSGEELSRSIGLSRTAVWKHIQELREAGCDIEAQPHLGYHLREAEQVLLPEIVAAFRPRRPAAPPRSAEGVSPGASSGPRQQMRLGEPLACSTSLPSTNDRAKELAAAGAAHGTAVLAWRQTRGRGRLGREWSSPAGGLWLSLILRPPLSPAEVPRLTLVSAVAVAEAVEQATGLRPSIKWPNDLLLDGRKVCGILTELSAEADRVAYVVVGIGLNANLGAGQLPAQAATPATSLQLALGRKVPLPSLAAAVLDRLEEWYSRFLAEGFDPVRSRWVERSATLGRFVTASLPGGAISGTAVDLAEDGALVVRLADGTRRAVLAGDVTLHSAEAKPK